MRNVIVDKVSEELYLFRMNDEAVKYFEAMWEIPEGITYNAYLLKNDDATILFDGWKREYEKEFVGALSKVIDLEEIDYVVVHHMEPDHSGTLPKILELNKHKATVLGHPIAGKLMRSFYNLGDAVKFKAVKNGEELQVGKTRLNFIYDTWLHWPDTILTYLPESEILITCDAFGGYSIPKTIYDDNENVVSEYLPYARKYVANIVGHFKKHIIKSIKNIEDAGLKPKIVAPAHGLIFKNNPERIVDYYLKVAKGIPEQRKVLVVYGSMYGFVEKAVNLAIREIRDLNFKPKIFKFTDKSYDSLSDIIGEVPDCEAIVLGFATYEFDAFPYMQHVVRSFVQKTNYSKPVLLLSAYGWGGRGVNRIKELLSDSKLRVVSAVEFSSGIVRKDEDRIREGVKTLLNA
ncbi:MAG TPA: FprA family A-type flavoprotein [Thermoplasmata archaeon]|nr:FprA family A-type flavoprotein [Thermoplasmata archaeon]HIH97690.1 FprA family A-type flavoprotein [Thermoplasmata archaeon]